jgi:hypothetical protein
MILSQVKKCLAMLENWQLLSLLLQTPPPSKPDKNPSPKISSSWSLQVNQEHPTLGPLQQTAPESSIWLQ